MQRIASAAFATTLLAAMAIGAAFLVGDSRADLDASAQSGSGGVFTSRAEQIELVVPRGWRATDLPSYPGLLLWMTPKNPPPSQMILSAEPFTREIYCSWPVACRMARDTSLVLKYACAIRAKLEAQRLRVGPTQNGPKENEGAGVPTVWFEFDDGKRFLRQAVGLTPDRAISLVLGAPTNEARASHVRHFDQALRTIRLLSAAESAAGLVDAGVTADDDALAQIGDANTTIVPAPDAGASTAPSAPPRTPPIGPCP